LRSSEEVRSESEVTPDLKNGQCGNLKNSVEKCRFAQAMLQLEMFSREV
jgi:hypothetical protein